MDEELATRFSDAMVSEIKAEMGRQDLSSRALARRIGSNPQFVSSRLDGGNPRTGERVILNIRDVVMIADALGLSYVELVQRAEAVAQRQSAADVPTSVEDAPVLTREEERALRQSEHALAANSVPCSALPPPTTASSRSSSSSRTSNRPETTKSAPSSEMEDGADSRMTVSRRSSSGRGTGRRLAGR